MALPSTGSISMSQVNTELKKSATAKTSLNDSDVRKLAGKSSGQIAMSDLRGKSTELKPQDCDYYFETKEDFNARRDSIIAENNNDLSQKTFGFGDGVVSLANAFEYTNIISTPKMIVAKSVTSFDSCFYGCSSLTTIPQGLFDKCPNVTNFSYCFGYCSSLTTIPQGLFDNCTNVTNFSFCFYNCNSLTTIPQGLFDNCPNATSFNFCFYDCLGITSAVPELWKTHPNADGIACFEGCINAANYNEIPADFK